MYYAGGPRPVSESESELDFSREQATIYTS